MKNALYSLLLLLISLCAVGQETFPVNGVHDERNEVHAFVNAEIYASSSMHFTNGTLLVQDGRVIGVGSDLTPPKGSVIHDCDGMVVYPSFIDLYAGFHETKKEKAKPLGKTQHQAGNWNPAIQPGFEYSPNFPFPKKLVDDWLAGGVGVALLHQRDGIMRGTGSLMHLGIKQPNKAIISPVTSQHFSFSKGSSPVDYPSSHIGAIALVRQTYYDAIWYGKSAERKEVNPSLAAINSEAFQDQIKIFELSNPLSERNVDMLEEEFGHSYIRKGTGKEYLLSPEELIEEKFIVPIHFPKPIDVSDPFVARSVALHELKHWESAPYNIHHLVANGAHVAITRDTLKSAKAFIDNLQRVNKTGVSHNDLLAMLTETPATWLGVSGLTGTLEASSHANFFIASNVFTAKSFQVLEHWNEGERVMQKNLPSEDLIGNYNLVVDSVDFTLNIEKIEKGKLKAKAVRKNDQAPFKAKASIERSLVNIVLINDSLGAVIRLSGKISLGGTVWDGEGKDANGDWVSWGGIKDRKQDQKTPEAIEEDSYSNSLPPRWLPNMAYGFDSLPEQKDFVITNAVVWTCADTGKLERADVWIADGKIKAVGSNMMYPSDLRRVDAKGRHLTPGIIDEHSHIAIRGGVNEWAQASSAEVRISDAIDPWNIQIYRHLAGGVTAAQLLHGSANPIGGQSASVKMKWGETADEMLIDGAAGFIKFALGENVKRSNSRNPNGRFPLTRMGVEQSFVDAFTRAEEYQAARNANNPPSKKGNGGSNSLGSTRVDLELEAMVEILNKERFISCHSYVQSEILMLMRVAEQFGFRVNTFTHILEGYKVAQEMKAHGVTGSTFSDWWAYKYEVNDAIPYNATLMTKVGVNTAINSDDAEMGRRLNQEAAKAIKYGGVSEEQALNMVTINPAKALHLEGRMGSIEVGKDADLVLWSGHPLSVYSHVDHTYIEGKKYFDLSEQEALHIRNETERMRIVKGMMKDPSKEKRKAVPGHVDHYHCDTELEDYWNK